VLPFASVLLPLLNHCITGLKDFEVRTIPRVPVIIIITNLLFSQEWLLYVELCPENLYFILWLQVRHTPNQTCLLL